ncbi:PREDICTED: ectonucleoside triphosphate diphosphohydrolase 5 isoform X2 [Nicrophorus vespilloides]|nr:PREDICTED: ectonucleoside triphosphate diphosphohydrolase 5 isoform X2 [Nicrophorus vespilloides]
MIIHQSLLCLIISGSILTLFVVLYTDSIPWHIGHKAADNVAKLFGVHEPQHAVVIDAGSTGSRVLAFTFHRAVLNRDILILDKELFVQTKPGLSAFADDPASAVKSISYLIGKAKEEIPQEYWNRTPLVLKATAGLRLLPAKKAENLLNAVKAYFNELPFLTNEDSVAIMDGTDEGIFSWFTVNFLIHKLNNPATTVAALDLGGGSTQVTFSALTPESLRHKEFIHDALLPKGTTQVYTNSYLGLGLMAARKEIITVNSVSKEETRVMSPCVNPVIKNRKFHYGGVDYFVSGLQENYPTKSYPETPIEVGQNIPIVDYNTCSEVIKKYVLSKVKPPAELSTKKVFAFSYYFDRAAEVGLIDEYSGGSVTIEMFKKAAEEACTTPNSEQPFMCLDLTFISVLLENGFDLDSETEIFLYKKINGHEISWALGAAFNLLNGK